MSEEPKKDQEMHLLDEPVETDSGMLLSLLADEPGEAESAMLLNSLIDDPEALAKDADQLIRAVDHRANEQ